MSRIRPTTWLLIAWTAFGAAGAYWGYRSVMAECPPPDDFSGCFEPPYRFAASVVFVPWAVVEAALLVMCVAPRAVALAAWVFARARERAR